MHSQPNNSINNLSSILLSVSHISQLNEGLTFSPHSPFNHQDHLSYLTKYNVFSNTLRNIAICQETEITNDTPDTSTSFPMKFLKEQKSTRHLP